MGQEHSPESLPYRPNVCMLVLNRKGQIFIGERYSQTGVWQLPQGGVEEDASEEENVLRELEEELGASRDLFQIEAKLPCQHRYDFRTPPAYAIGRWRGQEQTFWVVRFNGEDEEITLESEHLEFQSWRWCDLDRLLDVVEPVRHEGYQKALDCLADG